MEASTKYTEFHKDKRIMRHVSPGWDTVIKKLLLKYDTELFFETF